MDSKSIKRLIRSKSGLKIVAANDSCQSPFLLCEPEWIPDNEAGSCMECKRKFDFLTRRHHCRRCGRIYCKNCCDFRLELPRMCFVDPVRQCQLCADITRAENTFFDHDIKLLMNGANFQLTSTSEDECMQPVDLHCKLSADHRILTFDSGSVDLWETVEFDRITELSILRTQDQQPGMYLTYKDTNGANRKMNLIAAPEMNKRQAASWLSAMNNGFRMVSEVRS